MVLLEYTALIWLFMIAYRLFVASWRDTEADAMISVLNLVLTPLAAIFAFDIWWLLGNVLLFISWGWAIDLVEDEEGDTQNSGSTDTKSTKSYDNSSGNNDTATSPGGFIDESESVSPSSSSTSNESDSGSVYETDNSSTGETAIYDVEHSEGNDSNSNTRVYKSENTTDYCSSCGTELDANSSQRYCPNCGERLNR